MNLLSLFDASGWSYFLKDIAEGAGDYEGFAYLGAGGLLLLLVALPAVLRVLPSLRRAPEYWPLLVFLVGATLFALSNNVGFADHSFEIRIPEKLIKLASYLRSGGRMFWPAFYVLLWLLIRNVVKHREPRAALALLAVALLVQVVDTSAGWLSVKRTLAVSGNAWPTPLRARFWSEVPVNYREIRMVLPGNKVKGYSYFSYFAAMHDMATDAIYLARVDERKLKQVRRSAVRMINKGRYAKDTLYVLNRSFEKAASLSIAPERDLLATIDGFIVLAPGWKCRPQCHGATASLEQDCSATCPRN